MPYQFQQPLEVNDFSGGFTDNYLDGPINSGQVVENFLIQKNKKLLSRSGTVIYDSTNYQIPSGANRIGRLINHPQNQLFTQSESHLYYIATGTYNELKGPVDNNVAFPGNLSSNYISHSKWKNHVFAVTDSLTNPVKIYQDNLGAWQIRQAGLPALASSPTVAGTAGSLNYLYRLFMKYTYFVGTIQFEEDGPTLLVEKDSVTDGPKSISGIPVLANGGTGLYDTANITIEIYRTEGDATTYYKLGSVTNGTTTFSDTVTDAVLVTHAQIYTAGGVLDRDPAPPAKFIHIVNNTAIYGGVVEGGITYTSKYRMSVPNNPNHCPGALSDELELPITGINSVGIYPIIFCRDRMYRIEGIFDETGNGNPILREISRTKGCISNNGIIQIQGGLVFPGVDQFYFTDGYTVTPIDIHHVTSYKALVSSSSFEQKITGRYDSRENRVYWCVCDGTSTGDNNKIWVLDLNFPTSLTPESPFTKLANTGSWIPTDIEFIGTDLIIADERGYLFKIDDTRQTDPQVNTAVNPSTWNTTAVIWDFVHVATSFGTTKYFKFVPSIDLQAKNTSNVTIQVSYCNEDSGVFVPVKEIRVRDGIDWGTPGIDWGSDTVDWNTTKMIRALRRTKSGSLRSVYKQLQITNAYTIIYASDQLSTADIDAAAKTLTLTDLTLSFGDEVVNYYVSFAADSYVNQYLITTRNSATVITYSDSSNMSSTLAASKWQISGYTKNEQLNLLSFSMQNALVGENKTVWRGVTGGNA